MRLKTCVLWLPSIFVFGQICDLDKVTLSTNCYNRCESRENVCIVYPASKFDWCQDSDDFGNCLLVEEGPTCTIQCSALKMTEDNYYIIYVLSEAEAVSDKDGLVLDSTFGPIEHVGNLDGLEPDRNTFFFFKRPNNFQVGSVSPKLTFEDAFLKADTEIRSFNVYDVEFDLEEGRKWVYAPVALELRDTNADDFPIDIENMDSLRFLYLHYNAFTKMPELTDSAYDALQDVSILNVGNNPLESFDVPMLGISQLELESCLLESIPPRIFEMKGLTTLYVYALKQIDLLNWKNDIRKLNDNPMGDVMVNSEQYQFLRDLPSLFVNFKSAESCEGGEIRSLPALGLAQPTLICVHPDAQVAPPLPERIGIEDSLSGSNGNTKSGFEFSPLYIALAVGCILVLAIIIFTLAMGKRNKKRHQHLNESLHSVQVNDASYAVMPDHKVESRFDQDTDLLALRVPFREVKLEKVLRSGGFGVVWLANYRGKSIVAKKLLPSSTDILRDAIMFADEVKLMAKFRHPKIVQFLGVAWQSLESITALTEYMVNTDLRSVLENKKFRLTWERQKCIMAYDIADALTYLHSHHPPIMHRDLKARNVLVEGNLRCKLADFGLSRNRSYDETMTAGIGTMRWIAPEVALGEDYDESVDVYSFGLVLYEIDTHQVPYFDAKTNSGVKLQDVAIAMDVATGKLRPKFSLECPPTIAELANACLQHDPRNRPSASKLLATLRHYRSNDGSQYSF